MKIGSLDYQLRPVATLEPRLIDEAWELTRRYIAIGRSVYEASLRRKSRLALARDARSGELVGVTSMDTYPFPHAGRVYAIIFSGDVIVDADYWGRYVAQVFAAIGTAWLSVQFPLRPKYWFFAAFGYRAYLMVARNGLQYWPCHDRPTPPAKRRLIDRLARHRYGPRLRDDGTVAAARGKTPSLRLNRGTERLDNDPHFQFFRDRNPGFYRGDALPCLVAVSATNWATTGLRKLGLVLGNS